MKQVAIVAGGEVNDSEFLAQRLSSFDEIIAVDSGIRHLLKVSIRPHLIVGDLDSALAEEVALLEGVPLDVYPQEKDESDTEIALKTALKKGADQVTLFGALGGRSDHLLGNLYLVVRNPGKVSVETECETIYAICNNKKEASYPGQLVSFFSISDKAEGVSTSGLKWELIDAEFTPSFISLSNEALGHEFEVSVKKGVLLCIKQNARLRH